MADCLPPAGQAWYGRELHASILVRLPSYRSKHLCCEQPVKEIQLTNICYVQICVCSSFYGDFLWWIDHRLAAFADSTRSDRISSSQSPLLSFTPVRCMDSANFINVKVRVCYSFSKHNIFSTKAIESFVVVWIVEEICLKNRLRVSSTRLKKTLSLSLRTQRQCKWRGRK